MRIHRAVATVVLLAVVTRIDAASAAMTFAPHADYAVGSGSVGVAVADLNGDTHLDAVVVNTASNNVSVLLGTGTGALGPATQYFALTSPYGPALADLNHDGIIDLVTVAYGSSLASVRLGVGTGTFGAIHNFTTSGANNRAVAVADVNGDTHPDIVIDGYMTVSVLLGIGDGSFAPSIAAGPGGGSSYDHAIAVADFNGDNKPDVLAELGFNLAEHLGHGDGTFSYATSFGSAGFTSSVAVADLDANALLDVAVANADNGTVSVLRGDGAGSFTAATSFAALLNPRSVAIGDLSGDGRPDLAVACATDGVANSRVCVLPGDGAGAFGVHVDFPTGGTAYSVAIGDMNHDRRPDLIVCNSSPNTVSVLLNTTTPFVDVERQVPSPAFALTEATPNPASGTVRLGFTLPRDAVVRLSVVDVQGREVARLVDGLRPAGTYPTEWNTRSGRGSAGIYFVCCSVGGETLTRRVVVTR